MPDDSIVAVRSVSPEWRADMGDTPVIFDNRILLDGTWEFLHLVEDYRAKPIAWRPINVPGPWQAQFADLRVRGGTGIYRRKIEIPAGWMRDRIFLRFGAVFHITRAWVNDELVGMHVGGFLPFSFDVTEQLVEGSNEIKIRADSPTDDPNEFPEASFAEIPFGKQSWYGPLSGIWQSVWLERRAADHIAGAGLNPDWQTGCLAVSACLATPALWDSVLRVRIRTAADETVAQTEHFIPAGI